MPDIKVNCIVNCNIKLSEPTKEIFLSTPLAYNNTLAHAMRVTVYNDDGTEADLTGVGVTGVFLRADDNAVDPINGDIVEGASGVNNIAEIILPASCYIVPGRFTFSMNLTAGNATRTALWVEGHVKRNTSGTIIDPGTPVGNIEQAIGSANSAASAANAAAETATQAAAAAQDVVDNVEGEVDDLKSAYVNRDIVTLVSFQKGYIKSADGTITTSNSNYYSDMYPVQPGEMYHVKGSVSAAIMMVAYYKTDAQEVAETTSLKGADRDEDVIIPDGVYYVRFSRGGSQSVSFCFRNAVEKRLQNIQDNIDNSKSAIVSSNVENILTYQSGYVVASDGTIHDGGSNHYSEMFPVTPGDMYWFSGDVSTAIMMLAYYVNETDTVATSGIAGRKINESIKIPDGVNYARLCYDATHGKSTFWKIYPSIRVTYAFDHLTAHSINHQGYHATAQANTLEAFAASKTVGFDFIETDIHLTSDNVPVMAHDATITVSGTETAIKNLTYAQLAEYAPTIPTLEQTLILCKQLNLYPYLELKAQEADKTLTQELAKIIVDIVKMYNMQRYVTWISFEIEYLKLIIKEDKGARVAYILDTASITAEKRNRIYELETGYNEYLFDFSYGVPATHINWAKERNIPVEMFTIDDASILDNMNDYVSGVTSNTIVFTEYLRKKKELLTPFTVYNDRVTVNSGGYYITDNATVHMNAQYTAVYQASDAPRIIIGLPIPKRNQAIEVIDITDDENILFVPAFIDTNGVLFVQSLTTEGVYLLNDSYSLI